MNEEELELYLDAIDRLDDRLGYPRKETDLWEPLRDEYGYRVPGCGYVRPAPSHE